MSSGVYVDSENNVSTCTYVCLETRHGARGYFKVIVVYMSYLTKLFLAVSLMIYACYANNGKK